MRLSTADYTQLQCINNHGQSIHSLLPYLQTPGLVREKTWPCQTPFILHWQIPGSEGLQPLTICRRPKLNLHMAGRVRTSLPPSRKAEGARNTTKHVPRAPRKAMPEYDKVLHTPLIHFCRPQEGVKRGEYRLILLAWTWRRGDAVHFQVNLTKMYPSSERRRAWEKYIRIMALPRFPRIYIR